MASRFKPITSRVKLPELVEALQELTEQLGPGAKFPRVRDLSKELGVTLATLNQGLNRLEQLGKIERKGRTGIFVSKSLRMPRIGLVFGGNIFKSSEDYFYQLLLESCAHEAIRRNLRYSVFFDIPGPGEAGESAAFAHDDLMFAMDSGRLEGLMLAYCQGEPEFEALRDKKLPIVQMANIDQANSVWIDEEYLVRLAAGALFAEGCRSLGVIGRAEADQSSCFRQIAQELGFDSRETWICFTQNLSENSRFEEVGRRIGEDFLRRNGGNLPEGLIISNDVLARGFCQSLAAAGVPIGSRLKIATHANKNSPILTEWEPRLILCEIDPAEVASLLFDQLERLMAGEPFKADLACIRPHLKTPFPSLNQQAF